MTAKFANQISLGVDARSLTGKLSGIGRYVHETLLALDALDPAINVTLYCAPSRPSMDLLPSWKVRTTRLPRQIALKLAFGPLARKDQVDVFWAPQTLTPWFLGKSPIVSTVHDLNHILAPETMSVVTRLAHKLWFNADVRRARAVLTNSHGTALRLREQLGIEAADVAYPGVSTHYHRTDSATTASVLRRHGLKHPYLLSVSTLEPRKNIPALIRAYQRLRQTRTMPELVLVGQKGWSTGEELLRGPGVRALGYVDQSDLPALYTGAAAFLMPSLYEGYGMPAAEARACGCIVMVTDIPELREAAEKDAIFIQPSEDGIADGILRALAAEPPSCRRTQGWEECAQHYARLFRAVAAKR